MSYIPFFHIIILAERKNEKSDGIVRNGDKKSRKKK